MLTLQLSENIFFNDMTLTRLDDLFNEPEEQVSWLIEGMLSVGGFSVLASKPKGGKSTTVRNLSLCVAQGEPFLNRNVAQGAVIYYALEERKADVKRHFRDMGAMGDEEIYIYAGGAPIDAVKQIRDSIRIIKPVLVVIDCLFRLAKIKDGNDYAEVTRELEPLLRLARETGTHVLCTHHTSKSERQGGDSVLGSTAIFGSVDTLMLIKRHEKYRTLQTIQRCGDDLEETILNFDKDTRTITIGKSRQEEDITTLGEAIIEFLSSQDEPVIEATIMNEVEGRTGLKRKALRKLVEEKRVIREGNGEKGDPFKYSCSLVPTYIRERGNENPKDDLKPNTEAKNSCSQISAENDKSREQAFHPKEEFLDLQHEQLEIIE